MRNATALALAYALSPSLHAQLYDAGLRAIGPPCDTSLMIDFTVVDNGNMVYAFSALIDTGDVTIVGQTWNYLNVVPLSDPNPFFTAQFFTTGPTPVCLTVDAYDPQSQPCSTTACKVVTIYTDSICATLISDFTISSIQGNTVTFGDLSTFNDVITGHSWDFGDALTTSAPSPVHTFTGNGPFEVCLTVTGSPGCSTTACKWLYLGPGNVPCPTLLQPGFLNVVFDNTVGVLDTSTTTGMSYSIAWDFGDGSTATGPVAYHSYMSSGGFSVCETISLWGPLTPDTCVSTVCTPVYIAALGLGPGAKDTPLRVWPVPARGQLFADGLAPNSAQLELLDAVGRPLRTWSIGSMRPAVLNVQGLAQGVYMLRATGSVGSWARRVVLE